MILTAPASLATVRPRGVFGPRTYRNAAGVLITHNHVGLDFPLAAGALVHAAGDGRVIDHLHDSVRGFMIVLEHGRDWLGRWLTTHYHMVASAARAAIGTLVKAGQIIARVAGLAEWGSSSNGSHLHWETRLNGVHTDPYQYLLAQPAPPAIDPTDPTEDTVNDFTQTDRDLLARIGGYSMRSDEQTQQLLRNASGGLQAFLKHAGIASNLWLVVFPDGNFLRIRDHATAVHFKELNGGIPSLPVSGNAIRLYRDMLIAAGGRDLSEPDVPEVEPGAEVIYAETDV